MGVCEISWARNITFQQQETAEIKNRIRVAGASFHRCKQELTSRSYFLQHRHRLFNMVITPTVSCASGTWAQTREHERRIRSTQHKMLRFIVQTKRKYKKKTQPSRNVEDEDAEKANHRSSDEETAEGSSSNTCCDQDSDISFMKDSDQEIDTGEIEEEDWIEYLRRSTSIAVERMKTAKKIPRWAETHRRMNWRLAMRIVSVPDERWTKKAATWNPGLSTKYQTTRTV